MEGTLRRAGERWQLRFIRTLPYPPEKVWRALTEPEHLAAWFPSDIEGDREAGAKLRFVFRNGEGPPGDGEMLAYDPPSRLEFRWEDDLLRFDVRPQGEGCVLTLVTPSTSSAKPHVLLQGGTRASTCSSRTWPAPSRRGRRRNDG